MVWQGLTVHVSVKRVFGSKFIKRCYSLKKKQQLDVNCNGPMKERRVHCNKRLAMKSVMPKSHLTFFFSMRRLSRDMLRFSACK